MKVAVTGGAGCIGYALSRLLDQNGHTVVIFDLFEKCERIKEALPRVKVFAGSILDLGALKEAFKECDVVVHLAAHLGVERTESDPLKCLDVNIEGTKKVLTAARLAGVPKFIFASSSEVYGEPLTNPIDENAVTQGKTVYAISKLAGEEYVKAFYGKETNTSFVIHRFFNTYGPFQVAQFALSKFILNMSKGKPIVINGDGNQIRSFCHSFDVAQGIYASISEPRAAGEVFNLGNPDCRTTIVELARMIGRIGGQGLELSFNYKFQNTDRCRNREIFERFCSIEKARKILDFNPRISLQDGIQDLVTNNTLLESWDGDA